MPPSRTIRTVRVEDAQLIAKHRYAEAGTKEDLVAYERWVVGAD